MSPELIQSSTVMDELLALLANEQLIAVDTEFSRESSYYPQLALVQVATPGIVACIDPLAFNARPALRQLFTNRELIKVFHSCSQDMEVLYYYLDAIPVTVYDTQIAYALLSEDHQIGYALLVEKELGIRLDKSQTRTNWLQRPLTARQIRYAGDDVYYLYQLYQLLDNNLVQAGRKNWFEEDCARLTSGNNGFQIAIDKLWKRVKGSTRLRRDKLAIVQSIAVWREKLAQQKDYTRRKILADDIVLKLALEPPEDSHSLRQSIGKKPELNNEEQQQLLQAIKSALLSSPDSWPDNRFTALDKQQKELLKELQTIVTSKAEELNISPGILTSKKELEKLILYYQDKQELQHNPGTQHINVIRGWRYNCIGQQLLATINQ